MPDHDHDLIAAIAEGRLGPLETETAMRAIADDPAALADLEAQRLALSAMRAAAPVRLADAERDRLRRGVTEAIGLEESAAAPRPC